MNGLYDEIRLALYQVWTRRWLALGIAWGVCLLGWLVIALIPNSYQANARIFVQSQTMLSPELASGELGQRRDRERLEKTLTSSDALEKVVRSTMLAKTVHSEAELNAKVADLREGVAMKSTKENLFEVTATLNASELGNARTAQLSRDVLARLIDIFQEETVSQSRADTAKTVAMLNDQLESRRAALTEAEQAKIAFETNNLGLLPGAQSATTRASQARMELNQVESQLAQAQGSLAALNGQLAGTPATISTPVPGGGQSALGSAQGQLAAMRARGLTDAHPDVVAMRREIQALKSAGGSAGAGSYQAPNPAYSSLASMRSERQAEVAALRARMASLQQDISGLGSDLAAEPGVSAEYDRLVREYTVKKEQYDNLLAEREAVRLRGSISTETDADTFRVVQSPTVPSGPAAPNRPLLIAGVLFLGLAAGIGTAAGLGQIQTSFASPAKLERASGLPVLGTVSEVPTAEMVDQRARKQRFFFGAAASLPVVFCGLMTVALLQFAGAI